MSKENVNQFQFKLLHPDAKEPKKGTPGSNAFDLVAVSVVHTDKYVEYDTGVALELKSGQVGIISPRSSISNKDLIMCNSFGIIDSDYKGSIRFRFKVVGTNARNPLFSDIYNVGDRVGQLMVVNIGEWEAIKTNYLTSSERGEGGFGSTNK